MKITTKGDNLIVQLEGVERLWAFKTGLNLKRSQIKSIVWSHERPHWRDIIAVRSPGTGLPKVFYAGTFFSARRGWEFWYLQMREPGFLIINTSHYKYRTIRLTVTQGVGLELKRWLGTSTGLKASSGNKTKSSTKSSAKKSSQKFGTKTSKKVTNTRKSNVGSKKGQKSSK